MRARQAWPSAWPSALLVLLVVRVAGVAGAAWPGVRHDTSLQRTQASGVRCKVSHYGWVCDPNEKPMENFVRMGEAVDLEGEATEAVTEDQCCSTDCVEAEFQQTRKEALKQTGSTEFYVDFQRGDDAALGTRELPWRTLKRAQDKVRALRVASSDDLKLAHPVQVWVKDPSSFARPGSWHGITYKD